MTQWSVLDKATLETLSQPCPAIPLTALIPLLLLNQRRAAARAAAMLVLLWPCSVCAPEVHYLGGSVLIVPYPLLHQPHQGRDVVKLGLLQHP